MKRYKELSPAKPILICILIIAIPIAYLFYFITPNYDPSAPIHISGMKYVMAIVAFICSSVAGAIIGLIIYAIIKPSKEKVRQIRLMEEQNELIRNNMNNASKTEKNRITDELDKLITMKNNGEITEEEFKKFKEKIINGK